VRHDINHCVSLKLSYMLLLTCLMTSTKCLQAASKYYDTLIHRPQLTRVNVNLYSTAKANMFGSNTKTHWLADHAVPHITELHFNAGHRPPDYH